jgi:hypothetical protein
VDSSALLFSAAHVGICFGIGVPICFRREVWNLSDASFRNVAETEFQNFSTAGVRQAV